MHRCVINCSPNQATFANVTAVQQAPSNNVTALAEVHGLQPWKEGPFSHSCLLSLFQIAWKSHALLDHDERPGETLICTCVGRLLGCS